MKTKIKYLVKKQGNRYTVKSISREDRELAEYIVEKLLDKKSDGVEVEWVFSYESPLVKLLMSKQWFTWVFGCCAKEVGLIHIYLDNILKAYGVYGSEPVEEWFSNECSKHLIHELIHYHEPEWNESQVERASEHLHVLLAENNQVLKVKPT